MQPLPAGLLTSLSLSQPSTGQGLSLFRTRGKSESGDLITLADEREEKRCPNQELRDFHQGHHGSQGPSCRGQEGR